ncbi:MAG TPA: hypothetical protein VI094_11705 [Propionibacteriaceae bacterium]
MREQLKKMVVQIAELDGGIAGSRSFDSGRQCGPFERQPIGRTESSLAREARRQSIAVPIGFALWPSQQGSP